MNDGKHLIYSIISRLDEDNVAFNKIDTKTLETLTSYYEYTKDKEDWASVEEMLTVTQAKIRLTGWNLGNAIKEANERSKARRRRHREGK